jgi:hypothetical protein
MKISTILGHIDSGHLSLREFQRGYIWSRDTFESIPNVFSKGRTDGSRTKVDQCQIAVRPTYAAGRNALHHKVLIVRRQIPTVCCQLPRQITSRIPQPQQPSFSRGRFI